jgi:hypothetical protein
MFADHVYHELRLVAEQSADLGRLDYDTFTIVGGVEEKDPSRFETFAELLQRVEAERQAKEAALAQAEQERQTANALRAELERLQRQRDTASGA